jgi:heptosyltransferase-2
LKVLVIKIAASGDFLLATPSLRALKLADNVAGVSLLAGRSLTAVTQDNPHLDRIFYLNGRRIFHGGLLGKIAEVLKISWRLRRERFDLGFNFHRDWRFNIILFLAGCKRRIGFAGRRRSLLLTDAVRIEGVKHHVFQYCDLLKGLGIFCLDFKLEFPLSGSDLAAAAEKFLKPDNLGKFVVLALDGTANVKEEMDSRRWPSEHFAALAGMLIRDGQRVALLGSKGDVKIAASIKAAQPDVVDLTGRTTLAEAAALLKKARLVVCNDSGLMHLAAAVGAHIISIFGPSHPGERKPLAAGNAAVWKGEDMECSPCYKNGEFPSCDHVSCLKKITPREIFDLIES